MKGILAMLLMLALLGGAAGCALGGAGATPLPKGDESGAAAGVTPAAGIVESQTATEAAPQVAPTTAEAPEAPTELPDDATTIALGETITVGGPGASVDGTTVTVTAGGAYRLSGTLEDGQIVVDAQDKETVTLILDGVDVTCSTSAPIDVRNAEDVVIVLADGAENRLADGVAYVYDDPDTDEPNATLFSKDDLTITGGGALTIDANYNDALTGKDDLTIAGGVIVIDSVGDGIRGRDALVITGGTITVNAAGDGLESNNDEDPERGVITIEGGTVAVTAGQDGIEAETDVVIRGGSITVTTGGGSANASSDVGAAGNTWGRWPGGGDDASDDDTVSAKGIKAGVEVVIDDGVIRVDSSDDAVHSNDSIAINGGDIHLASGDDGVHANTKVTIGGGDLTVSQSYEALESANITITGGNLHLVARDDGINVAGGVDGSALGGRPGQNTFAPGADQYLRISGGYVYVDGMGDGIDVNGAIAMSAGTVIVNGPASAMNGALDYDRGFTITGGTLVAVGSAGMAQAPDASSTQYVVRVNLPAVQPAGTLVHIEDEGGRHVLTFLPVREYQSVVLSSPDLANGATYLVYVGGNAAGPVTDGVYTGGEYAPGEQVATLTISGIVTGEGGGPGRGPRGR